MASNFLFGLEAFSEVIGILVLLAQTIVAFPFIILLWTTESYFESKALHIKKKLNIFINIWFAIWRLNKYILYGKGFLKVTQSVKWNEIYKWKDDMKHPGYEPELICAQD